jgi:AmpE protein
MTIISLLLVLVAERMTTKSQYWQFDYYFQRIVHNASDIHTRSQTKQNWWWLAIILVPTLLVYIVVQRLSGSFVELVLSTLILMVCIGCPAVRATYKCFLQAANRGDLEACSLYAEQLGDDEEGIASFGHNLVWQNYQHYAAVILWFSALGASGALLYVLTLAMQEHLTKTAHPASRYATAFLHILDWLPVRITALGFLLVGHFSRALPIWLGHVIEPNIPAKTLLLDVAKQAEEIEPDDEDCTQEPCILVRLAKRNVMFLLVVIALLTLTGWLN